MKFALAICSALLWGSPACAGLTESDLASVQFVPPPNARVPLNRVFQDAGGHQVTLADAMAHRPGLLLPLDYACSQTCGPALSIISSALKETGITAGRDYRLVLIGLDPQSTASEARAFTEARIHDAKLLASTSILTGNRDAIHALTDAIGYRYRRDQANKAFAHPTALVVLTADGKVSRALSSLALNAIDLRLALTEASDGRIGGVLGRLSLICYGFDAVHGIYTSVIERLLTIAGVATVMLVAGAVAAMSLMTRRHGAGS